MYEELQPLALQLPQVRVGQVCTLRRKPCVLHACTHAM